MFLPQMRAPRAERLAFEESRYVEGTPPGGQRPHLDHDVETDPLGLAAFLLEGADIDLDDMIAQADPVERMIGPRGTRPRVGMLEGQGDFIAHRCLSAAFSGMT